MDYLANIFSSHTWKESLGASDGGPEKSADYIVSSESQEYRLITYSFN
jgi:hypothetical protein